MNVFALTGETGQWRIALCFLIGFFPIFSAFCGNGHKMRVLTEFLQPEMVNLEGGLFSKKANDAVHLIPDPSAKKIVLKLKKGLEVSPDTAWFTIPFYAEISNLSRCYVELILENEAGKEFVSKTFRAQNGGRTWQNLLSEWTFFRKGSYMPYDPSLKKKLKVSALHISIPVGTKSVYFKAPVLFGGNLFDSRLIASNCGGRGNDWYGEMAPVAPAAFLDRRKYVCTLLLYDAFQKKPVYETTKNFDFTGNNLFAILDNVFHLPLLPVGTRMAELIFRNPETGELLRRVSVRHAVMSSLTKTMPACIKSASESGAKLFFLPDSENFIFPDGPISGRLEVLPLASIHGVVPASKIQVEATLREYNKHWYRNNANRPKVYASEKIRVEYNGGTYPIRLHGPISGNTPFVLKLELFENGKRLDSVEYTVGVRGKESPYKPYPGKVLSWEEMKRKPLLTTGNHMAGLPDIDIENYVRKIRTDGAYGIVTVSAAWGNGTEPLKGFYTTQYLDKFLAELHKNGLKAEVLSSGEHEFPSWAVFEARANRVDDGRFLTSMLDWADTLGPMPLEYIKANQIRLIRRYVKEPTIVSWKIWGAYGECFFSDWWLMWMYGDSREGYSTAGRAALQKFLQKKYLSLDRLNKAYGTTLRAWNEILVPPRPPEQRRVFPLRNPRQFMTPAYRDFMEFKQETIRDYYENHVAKTLRKLDPVRMFIVFYYADAEGEYMHQTKDFFKKNPGFWAHNGGAEGGANGLGQQFFAFRAYEGVPMMTEDVRVWNDDKWQWFQNIYYTYRNGGKAADFFNYSIYQSRRESRFKNGIELESHDAEKTALFRDMRRFLQEIKQSQPVASKAAVFFGNLRYDNFNTANIPGAYFIMSGFPYEPLNDNYLERLPRYRAVALDSGMEAVSSEVADALKQWVKNGGTLFLTPAAGAWEEGAYYTGKSTSIPYEQPHNHGHFLLRKFGLELPPNGFWGSKVTGNLPEHDSHVVYSKLQKTICEWDKEPFTAKTVSAKWFPRTEKLKFFCPLCTYVFPKNAYPQAEVLAVYESPKSVAGSPAALRLPYGKGALLLFAQYPIAQQGISLYTDLLRGTGTHSAVRFTDSAGREEPLFNNMQGYILKHDDGSYILMTLELSRSGNFNFTPSKPPETKSPYRRNIHVYGIEGTYEVVSLVGERKSAGDFNAESLATKGITTSYVPGELKIFKLIRKRGL